VHHHALHGQPTARVARVGCQLAITLGSYKMNKKSNNQIYKRLKSIKNKLFLYYGLFIPLFTYSVLQKQYKFEENIQIAVFILFFIFITVLWVSLYSTICPSCKRSFFSKNGMPPFYFSTHCKNCNIGVSFGENKA